MCRLRGKIKLDETQSKPVCGRTGRQVTCGLQQRDLAFVMYIADHGKFGGQTSKAGSDAASSGFRNVAAKGAENPNLILPKTFVNRVLSNHVLKLLFGCPGSREVKWKVGAAIAGFRN